MSSPLLSVALKKSLPTYFVLALTLALTTGCFWGLKHLWLTANVIAPWLALGVTGAVVLASCFLKSSDIAPAGRIFYRAITLILAAFILVTGSSVLPTVNPAATQTIFYLQCITALCAVISWFRPSAALLVLFGLLWLKRLHIAIYGIEISFTDWQAVFETTVFYILTQIFWQLLKRNTPTVELDKKTYNVSELFIIPTIAIHFGNYFYSGLDKILLNGGAFSWLFEDKPWWLTVFAHQNGMLPFDHIPWLRDGLFDFLQAMAIPGNVFILLIQVGCIFLFRWRWALLVILLLFDASHLLILAASGIFFWKWIALNTFLVIALERVKSFSRIPLPVVAACIVITIFCGSLFYIVSLRWYDSPAANMASITVITKDGKEARVPSNYFMPLSIHAAQMDYTILGSKVFKTGTWGSTMDYTTMKNALNNCALPILDRKVDAGRLPAFKNLLLWTHDYVVAHSDEKGMFDYDLYPHHIWSNPWMFDDFYRLDKRQIAAYRIDIKAVCLAPNLKDEPRIMAQETIMIPVGK